jgi:hypothetical protein
MADAYCARANIDAAEQGNAVDAFGPESAPFPMLGATDCCH